jgi:hypothetical protein
MLMLAMGLLASVGSLHSYWDTLPVGIHGGIRQRPQSDIAFLTKFRVVVGQRLFCIKSSTCTEDYLQRSPPPSLR